MTHKTVQQTKSVLMPDDWSLGKITLSKIKRAYYIKTCSDKVWEDETLHQIMASYDTGPETLWVTSCADGTVWWFLGGLQLGGIKTIYYSESVDLRGWNLFDLNGGRISGSLLNQWLADIKKSQDVVSPVEGADLEYVQRKIQGLGHPQAEEAWQLRQATRDNVGKLIQLLTWEDFDSLVYKFFCINCRDEMGKYNIKEESYSLGFYPHMSDRSEWAKVSYAGTQQELDEFALSQSEPRKLFYVYHHASNQTLVHASPLVEIMGPKEFARKVLQSPHLVKFLMLQANME